MNQETLPPRYVLGVLGVCAFLLIGTVGLAIGLRIGHPGTSERPETSERRCIETTGPGPHGRACVEGTTIELLICDDQGCVSAGVRPER